MYANQIWTTPYLRQGKEMDKPIQKWLLAVLKRTLEVRYILPHGVPCKKSGASKNVIGS